MAKDLNQNFRTVVPLAVLAIAAALWIRYCSTYFFLFDDFALVGQSTANSVLQVFTLPLFGFYRPLVFLIVKGEANLFGWAFPAGYLAFSYLIHLTNGALVYRLFVQMGGTRHASSMAAVLFVLSPWSSEAYTWASAGFDVISTFGMLSCVLAGLLCIRTATPGRGIAIAVLGICAAALALTSKEGAVVVPLIAAAALACVRSSDDRRRPLGWVYVAGLAVAASAYLVLRGHILPDLGGTYGNAYALFRGAPLAENALRYLGAFVTFPFPGVRPGVVPSVWILLPAAAALAGTLWCAFRASPRTVIFALTSLCLAVTPTLWTTPGIGSSAGGRLLYFPGVWVCMIVAGGMAGLTKSADRRPSKWARAVVGAAATGMYALLLVSVGHQFSMWSTATTLSRAGVQQFAAVLTRGAARVYIPNLPFWFEEGPYVLKDYAFSYYFQGRQIPIVRTRNMVLSRETGRAHFAGWTAGETAPVATDEVVLRLRLPIDGIPAPMSLRPEKCSVLVAWPGHKSSDVTIALDGPDAGDWHIESPAPEAFTVEPPRGHASATLRIVPHTIDATFDRTFSVPVWAGQVDRVEALASLTLRIKATAASGTAPPFGAVDVPADPIVVSSAVIVLQGWVLDDLSLRRIWPEAVDEQGRSTPVAFSVVRGGERPDVSKVYPNAHDLFNASWAMAIEPAVLARLRPTSVNVLAEDADGHKAVIGTRTLRWRQGP